MPKGFKVSIWLGLLFASLLLGLARAQTLTVDQKIDPKVLTDLRRDGKVTFFVVLREQMDASHAITIRDRKIRGEAVVNSLKKTAARTQAPIIDFLARAKAEVTTYWIVNTIKVTTDDERLIQDLAAFPDVALIKADETWQIPEPLPGAQEPTIQAVEWGVARVRAPEVWQQFGVRGQGIVIANIDTGVQFNHPALVPQYRGLQSGGTFDHNYNWHDPSQICGNPSLIPCDNNGHGTHTMGTAVGDDGGANQIGVAPGAKWIAAKGCESNFCSFSALLSSGQWVLAPTDLNGQNPRPDLRPHIVNNSWGGGGGSTFYQATVQAWRNAGIFPAFSIGNSGSSCGTAGSPGDYPESFGVGAIDIFDNIAGFSSRGPANGFGGIVKPNVSAPGVNVRSSVPTNSYANFSGTSMAAPHVAGVVALLWAALPELVGNIAGTEDILQRTAQFRSSTQCGSEGPPNNVYGWGIVDSLAAVQDSTATVTIAATDPNAAEAGPDPGTFTVSRTGSTASSLTVFYAVGGSATNGTDYQSLSGSVTIQAGSSSAPIPVNPIDDSLVEGDESVVVQLQVNAAYNLGNPNSATVTIADNDKPTVAFSAASSSALESVNPANLPVSLSAVSGQTVTVDYAVTGGTATGGGVDYTLASGTLTFNPGETTKNIQITVVNDALDELDETIQVTLSNPSNATLGTNTVHTYTINDDDNAPSLSINDVTVAEGNAGTVNAVFTVSLSAASGQTATVQFATANGTATAGSDYVAAPLTTLTFNPGETSKTVTVQVNGDTLDEINETFFVNLSGATNATISDGQGQGTITDDDAPPPDTTAPIAGVVTPSNTQFGSFVDSPFDLTTSFTDNESAVTSCEYTINGGTTWSAATVSGSAPNFACTKTGITGSDGQVLSLNMRATSSGGTGTATAVGRTVDTAAPTTTNNAPVGWVGADQTVTLTPSDGSGSGIASTQYCTDTANSCTPSTDGTSVPVTCGAGAACQTYVRYRSTDNVGNVEAVKSALVRIDKAAPAAVSDLSANSATQTSVTLAWSNPADSGSGNVSFDVRYRIGSTFSEADWAGASQASGEPSPPTTGMTVGSLSCGTIYAFALKTTDSVGNISSISNTASQTTSACVPPDLIISSLSAPTKSGAGLTISVKATTKNRGEGTAGQSTTRVYLSTNTKLDGDVELCSPKGVGPLGPGAYSRDSFQSCTIPQGTAPGTYYVIVKADADDDNPGESSETNNTKYKSIRIGPDLIISSLSAPSSAPAGSPISITDITKNIGGGTAPASTTRFYLSKDKKIGSGDALLGNRAVSSLGPNKTSKKPTPVTIPADTVPGKYFIIAKADADDAIPEFSERNNIKTRAITIGP